MVVFCCKMVKMAFFYVRMKSYSKMTAFSDFENASIVFLATFPVVYEMKLEQKVALGGSKCCEWRYFAPNWSTSAFSDAIMTSYSKMTAFSDFENASNVFLATFYVVYGMKLEQKVALDGSNCRKWWYFAEKW